MHSHSTFSFTSVPRQHCERRATCFRKRADCVMMSNSKPAPCVSAVVGSGFLGLNPALVTIEVIPLGNNDVKVTVVGRAKEGLIKQRGGEKAARRIAGRLQDRLVG